MRLEEQKTETYIDRLREDLAENIEDFNQRKAYFNQVRSHAIAASDALTQSTEILGEQFLIDIYQASQYMPREFGRDTYNEILSTGALNSESNKVIRKRLSNFYRSIKAQLVNVESTVPYRLLVRSIIPYRVQRAIKEDCDDIISTGKNGEPILALPEKCSLDLTPEQISNAVNEIKESNVKHALTQRISLLDTLGMSVELILGRVEMLDNYLKTAL